MRRIPLTEKQTAFFRKQRQTLQAVEIGMRGALQLIVEEHELTGKVSLSEDLKELVVEDSEQPPQPMLETATSNGVGR